VFRVYETKESITSRVAGSAAPVRVFSVNVSANDEFVAQMFEKEFELIYCDVMFWWTIRGGYCKTDMV